MQRDGRRAAPGRARESALARWAHLARRGMGGRTTPAAEAARRIADAILDDASPLRIACDDVGGGLIASADAAPFEARLAGALRAMPGREGEDAP